MCTPGKLNHSKQMPSLSLFSEYERHIYYKYNIYCIIQFVYAVKVMKQHLTEVVVPSCRLCNECCYCWVADICTRSSSPIFVRDLLHHNISFPKAVYFLIGGLCESICDQLTSIFWKGKIVRVWKCWSVKNVEVSECESIDKQCEVWRSVEVWKCERCWSTTAKLSWKDEMQFCWQILLKLKGLLQKC